jgi:hypothetical protein
MPHWFTCTTAPALPSPPSGGLHRDHALTCVDQFLQIGPDGLPGAIPLAVEGTEPIVAVVEALSDKVPAWRPRHIELDPWVIEREDGFRIAVSGSVVQPTHDLNILLRHRPGSIPPEDDARGVS